MKLKGPVRRLFEAVNGSDPDQGDGYRNRERMHKMS